MINKTYDYLIVNGFKVSPWGAGYLSPIHTNEDDPIRSEELLNKLNGRLSNVAYMAKRIDEDDGVSNPAESGHKGSLQYRHLQQKAPTDAKTYKVMRRLQRENNNKALYEILIAFLQYEDDLLPESMFLKIIEKKI